MIHPLLDAGRMPHLQRLVEGGVMGNLPSLAPMFSPILRTSIATGKRVYGHGVHGSIEPTPDRAVVRPVGTRPRPCKALWNILSKTGLRLASQPFRQGGAWDVRFQPVRHSAHRRAPVRANCGKRCAFATLADLLSTSRLK